jgi:hypothetical protein
MSILGLCTLTCLELLVSGDNVDVLYDTLSKLTDHNFNADISG